MLADEKIADRNVTIENRIDICNALNSVVQEIKIKNDNEEIILELDAVLDKYMGKNDASIGKSSRNSEIAKTNSSTSLENDDSQVEEQINKIVNNILSGNGSPPMNPAKKLRSDEKEEDGDEKKEEKEEKEKKRKNKGDDVVVRQYDDNGKPPDGGGSGPSSSQPSSGSADSSGSITGAAVAGSQTESSTKGKGTSSNQKESQSLEAKSLQLQNTVDTNIAIKKSDASKLVPDTIRQRSQSLPVKRQAWMVKSEVQLEKQVIEESQIGSSLRR